MSISSKKLDRLRTRLAQSRDARSTRSISRRGFLKQGTGLGFALGLPPLLASCGGDDDDDSPPPGHEARTLFFNFAHESDHATKNYFFEAAGKSYRLTRVADAPDVLRSERQRNAFLTAVPDKQITHHVSAIIPGDSVSLGYVGADIDKAAGTWSMSSIYMLIPSKGIQAAYARARASSPHGALALSAKREKYGIRAAHAEQDLHDEAALLDTVSHAYTLVGLHPDVMALAPEPAGHVQTNLIDRSIDARLLDQTIASLGPALPAATPGQPNGMGWATLDPLKTPDGKQLKVTTGPDAGRLQYRPLWSGEVATGAGNAMVSVAQGVKDDPTLGGDSTPGNLKDGGAGLLWLRRDGRPTVEVTAGAKAAGGVQLAFKDQSTLPGLDPKITSTSGRTASVDIENWYLRYLGVYLQFIDEKGGVIKLNDMPEYQAGTILDDPAGGKRMPSSLDADDTMFVSLLPPINTVMGIPMEFEGPFGTGSTSFTFHLPAAASTVRVLAGGLGCGSNNYPFTVAGGAAMTSLFCYGLTAVFAAAGAAAALELISGDILNLASALLAEITAIVAQQLGQQGGITVDFYENIGETLVTWLVGYGAGEGLGALVAKIVAAITAGGLEKVIPIAGEIMAAISAAIGVADIILTSVDLALSPWTYVKDIAGTYDLSVTLKPDQNASTFPADADSYKVTAIFDDGTPHTQTLPLKAPVSGTLPPVLFPNVPVGGNVNVLVSFAQTAIAANQSDILLGNGQTDSQPNDGSAKSIQITEIPFPIGPTTQYRHQQKTQLDDSDNHVWVAGPAPTTDGSTTCGGVGTICDFLAITVRQGTQSSEGYLGYSWQAQNFDPQRGTGCFSKGAGKLSQLANVNTNPGANGSGAQQGYAASGCGIEVDGVKVAYSLLGKGAKNFYLDTTVPKNPDQTGPILRGVTLDGTTGFDDPTASGTAWGALNMGSDVLLLHPAGHVISINGSNHKIETHKLPASATDDATARKMLRAQVRSGLGSRPGLIDTPAAAAVSADGIVLVLEAGNNRIQAFDIGANAVPYFGKQSVPHFLQLDSTSPDDGWAHLDMACEYTGFIYVLSQNESQYQLNVYHPTQSGTAPICSTSGILAARIAVDLWRSLYTLNYEVITRQNPGNSNPPGFTEPSVSLWTPCDVGRTCT